MAEMKSWLKKLKNNLLKSKIQSEENENKVLQEKCKDEKEKLPDLITPIQKLNNKSQQDETQVEIQREEAIELNLKDCKVNISSRIW